VIKLSEILNQILSEKKADRCKRIADRKYDKPSAYKSGAIVRCRKGDIWKNIKEIQKTTSLVGGNIDYTKFVDWAKGEADKITNKKEKYQRLEFQWAENSNGVKVIVYENSIPLGYIGLGKFEDGYKISTLGVKDEARGKGLATKMYDYVISKTKLYSDKMQTPEARKLWAKLASKYNVQGYNKKDKQLFNVKPENGELTSTNPKYELYSNKDSDTYLVIKEVLQEDESLHKWFNRSGPKGKEGGWVDCNAPDGKGGYKACGRKEGEKRAKYPACRPTPAGCKRKGKGKTWGKTK